MRINHAVEVANLLKHNIVQGVRESEKEDANWGMCDVLSFLGGYFFLCCAVVTDI